MQENIQAREDEHVMTSSPSSLLISFHLHKLDDESQTFILQLEQVIQVKNLKPASIKIYDYYQPGELQIPSYNQVGGWVPSSLAGKRWCVLFPVCMHVCVIVFLISFCRGASLG